MTFEATKKEVNVTTLETLLELVSVALSPPIIWTSDIENMRNQAESKRGEALEEAREMLIELVVPF